MITKETFFKTPSSIVPPLNPNSAKSIVSLELDKQNQKTERLRQLRMEGIAPSDQPPSKCGPTRRWRGLS